MPIIQVFGQIGELYLRQHGLYPRNYQLLWRYFSLADLIAQYQVPHKAENQLEITVGNVSIADIHQSYAIIGDCIQGKRNILQALVLIKRILEVPLRNFRMRLLQGCHKLD